MQTFFHSLATGFTAVILAITGFFSGGAIQPDQNLGATVPTTVALFETSLASSITSSATTMTLTSAVDKAGTSLASSTYAFVLDSGTSGEEMVLADCTGSYCTNMTRGISPITGNTGVASLQYSHRRGASVKITDGPQLLILSRIINGNETFPNKISYASAPAFTSGNEIVTKTYVDGIAIAGSPDASTATKGISKLTVSPASSTNPIAVGSNDPQFVQYYTETGAANAYVITPSPSIGAYAVGQHFSFKAVNANTTVSTLNINALGAKTIKKLAGATDLASGDIGAGQIVTVEYDGTNFQMTSPVGTTVNAPSGILPVLDGSALTGVSASQVVYNDIAQEAISTRDAVSVGYSQTDGGIKVDVISGGNTTLATFSTSITIANQTNRILIVSVSSNRAAPVNSITYNGVAMTKLDEVSNLNSGDVTTWSLVAPTVGTNSLVINQTGANGLTYTVHSYYNVTQVNPVTHSMTNGDTTGARSISLTTQAGSVGYGVVVNKVAGTGTLVLPTNNIVSATAGQYSLDAGDSGQIMIGSTGVVISSITGAGYYQAAGLILLPVTTPTYGIVKSSSLNGTSYTIPSSSSYRYLNFLGFAPLAISTGVSGKVQTDGIVTGFTGLIPGATYYLQDTYGTIGLTTGTNSKKVGIAVSSTSLLIKQDNV